MNAKTVWVVTYTHTRSHEFIRNEVYGDRETAHKKAKETVEKWGSWFYDLEQHVVK